MIEEGMSSYQLRALFGFGLFFAFLMVYSLFDMVFLAFGRDGVATVTDSRVSSGRRGGSPTVTVYYKFQEPDGHERTGHANIGSGSEKVPEGTEIAIQYLPRWMLDAPDASRPARDFNWFVLGLTIFACAGSGFFAYRAIRSGNPPARKAAVRRH